MVDGTAGSSGGIMGATSVVFRLTEVFCHVKIRLFLLLYKSVVRTAQVPVFRILVSLPPYLLQEMSLPGVADIHQKKWRRRCLLGNRHSTRH